MPTAGALTSGAEVKSLRALPAVPSLRVVRAADDRPPRELEIIVPAYNEASRLPATLMALQAHLTGMQLDSAIVVVDNGSVDRTVSAAAAVGGQAPVYVVGCAEQGKGAAVRRGVLTSRSKIVGFQDADLSTPLSTLSPVLRSLAEGADIAIAVRRGNDADAGDRSLVRRLGSGLFSSMSVQLTGVQDSQCGFKFFSAAAAEAVFSKTRIDGFAFDVEVLGIARRLGLRVDLVPVNWTAADGSTFRPLQDGVRSFVEVARIRRLLAVAS